MKVANHQCGYSKLFTIDKAKLPEDTAEVNGSGTAFFGSKSPRLVANAGAADFRGGFNCKVKTMKIKHNTFTY